jgi:RNA recognition motif-containing protein
MRERPSERFTASGLTRPFCFPFESAFCASASRPRAGGRERFIATESLLRTVQAGVPRRPRVPLKRERGEDCKLSNKLYVGNLPFTTTEDELRSVFQRHGSVDSVNVITDRETGRPRGFAFVEMSESSAAQDAIRALDGTELGGRSLRVNEAQDKRGGGGGRY